MTSRKLKIQAESGQKYGHFELLMLVGMNQYGQQWRVRCDCGKELVKALAYLRYQSSRDASRLRCLSCGLKSDSYRNSRRRAACAALAARVGDKTAFDLLDRMNDVEMSDVEHDLSIERSLHARERR